MKQTYTYAVPISEGFKDWDAEKCPASTSFRYVSHTWSYDYLMLFS
jgi:hypothetical protein